MVDLEDVEVGEGVAIGEGVEPGSEEDVLGGAVGDCCGEGVFHVAAASDDEGAEGHGEGLFKFGGGFVEILEVFGAEDGDGDGIVEDEGRGIVHLVGSAAECDAECGAGWLCWLHRCLAFSFLPFFWGVPPGGIPCDKSIDYNGLAKHVLLNYSKQMGYV